MGIREEFEKLNEIRDNLSEYIVFIGNTYTTPNPDFYDLVNWLNGAWYVFQEQQKKIDALKEKINNVVRVVYNETDDYYIDEKIQEILHDA